MSGTAVQEQSLSNKQALPAEESGQNRVSHRFSMRIGAVIRQESDWTINRNWASAAAACAPAAAN